MFHNIHVNNSFDDCSPIQLLRHRDQQQQPRLPVSTHNIRLLQKHCFSQEFILAVATSHLPLDIPASNSFPSKLPRLLLPSVAHVKELELTLTRGGPRFGGSNGSGYQRFCLGLSAFSLISTFLLTDTRKELGQLPDFSSSFVQVTDRIHGNMGSHTKSLRLLRSILTVKNQNTKNQ